MSEASLPEVTVFPDAAAFRAWLDANHAIAGELWIGYYKKGVPKTSMTYAEAVEEALCYGWIDGKARRIDDEITGQRFTPRRRTSSWSAINFAKIAELTAAGRMHPAGTRAFEERDRRRDASYSYEREAAELGPDQAARFQANPQAWSFWSAAPPSYRRTMTHWVTSAKRPETRERRLDQLIEASAARQRL